MAVPDPENDNYPNADYPTASSETTAVNSASGSIEDLTETTEPNDESTTSKSQSEKPDPAYSEDRTINAGNTNDSGKTALISMNGLAFHYFKGKKEMVTQKSQVIVQITAIAHGIVFESSKERLDGFDDAWFWIQCEKNRRDVISVCLFVDCPIPLTVEWICSINGQNKGRNHEYTKHEGCRIANFGKESDLFKKDKMIINSTLIVTADDPEIVQQSNPEIAMNASLLDEEKFKDFTICVGEEVIEVHKCILNIASPVFSAMLEPHTEEFQQEKVVIKDCDYETVKAAVNLIYQKKLSTDLSIEILLNLYKFADKYDLVNKKQVSQKLNGKINLKTVAQMSKFAKDNFMDELYEKCGIFCRRFCEKYLQNSKF